MQTTIFDLVHRDLALRDRLGWQQHGKPLLPHNGKDSLVEAYEEALDLAVYLRKAIAERESHSDASEVSKFAPMANGGL